jgi:hypothetical protein
MNVKGYYRQLLDDIAVKYNEIEAARRRRDELRDKLKAAVSDHAPAVETFPAGALAAGTQISPLNDVDVAVTVPSLLSHWDDAPQQALRDVRSWVEPTIRARFEISTHAIKLTYPDEDFTADIVVGVRRARGIVIPHCPKDEEHAWLPTDPQRHAEMVRERKLPDRPAVFSQQIRILKALNRNWQMSAEDGRKPLASFHLTALALAIFAPGSETPHDQGTPFFLERAADMVLRPLPDPAGIGPDLEARNPHEASAVIAVAAEKTRRALSLPEDEAIKLLDEVFGDSQQRTALLSGDPLAVVGSKFMTAAAAATAAPAVRRSVPSVRSHGD